MRELHDKACPCLKEAITNRNNALEKFIQMCICRLHRKLGKELVVEQCLWSLTHYHNKASFGHLNKPSKLVLCKSHSPRPHSHFWSSLETLNYPSGSTEVFQRSTSLSPLLLLYPISLHLPHVFPLSSVCDLFPHIKFPPSAPSLSQPSLLLGQRSLQSPPLPSSTFTGCTRWRVRHDKDPREHTKHPRNNHALFCTEAK